MFYVNFIHNEIINFELQKSYAKKKLAYPFFVFFY